MRGSKYQPYPNLRLYCTSIPTNENISYILQKIRQETLPASTWPTLKIYLSLKYKIRLYANTLANIFVR